MEQEEQWDERGQYVAIQLRVVLQIGHKLKNDLEGNHGLGFARRALA